MEEVNFLQFKSFHIKEQNLIENVALNVIGSEWHLKHMITCFENQEKIGNANGCDEEYNTFLPVEIKSTNTIDMLKYSWAKMFF